MFLGHFGLAFAAKRVEPRIPLWALFTATQLVDIAWMWFILFGIERVEIAPGITKANALNFVEYPYTHSLLGACAWAALAMAATWLWFRQSGKPLKPALIVGATVLSHYFLDVIVHRPDLTLAGEGTATFGLGLWNSIPFTLTLELGMLGAGMWIYFRATRPVTRAGVWAMAVFMTALAALWMPSVFGSVPPSATAIAFTGIATTPIILLTAGWLEQKRTTAT